jgi:hypothetical protein
LVTEKEGTRERKEVGKEQQWMKRDREEALERNDGGEGARRRSDTEKEHQREASTDNLATSFKEMEVNYELSSSQPMREDLGAGSSNNPGDAETCVQCIGPTSTWTAVSLCSALFA